MSKANEPAYPHHVVSTDSLGYATSKEHEGLSKREKLAMEIYVRVIDPLAADSRNDTTDLLASKAKYAIAAADIFFEQLNK